jgi:IstB-like ATP binding protein
MRQTHGAAEKLFVDFAGDTMPVFDAAIEAERHAHIFVAVLGASNYTYAEARWSEGLADWIGAHVNAFSAIGGVPKAVVCDNLKAGVTAVCRYEPGINRTSQELAEHYDTLPTRPRRPRDKTKVEVAVQIVQRFVLARLRNRRFFSLHELNAAIREIVTDLNAKIMRKLGVWIACALGHKACRDNRSVLYQRLPRLFDVLTLARGDGHHARLLKSLARVELLILDDWGLAPMTAEQRRDLLEIMEDRHGRGSTMVTSQLPLEHWHEIIGDPTLADAILDRLVHNSHRLTLKGESLRKAAAKLHKLDDEPTK